MWNINTKTREAKSDGFPLGSMATGIETKGFLIHWSSSKLIGLGVYYNSARCVCVGGGGERERF